MENQQQTIATLWEDARKNYKLNKDESEIVNFLQKELIQKIQDNPFNESYAIRVEMNKFKNANKTPIISYFVMQGVCIDMCMGYNRPKDANDLDWHYDIIFYKDKKDWETAQHPAK